MIQQQQETTENKFYLPFDEYLYRKIADLCLDFVNTYKELESDNGITVIKLENIFECLLDFAQNSTTLPDNLVNPPLKSWELSPDNIHPRLALNWVMRLLNELKRQQEKVGRDRDYYVKEYLKTRNGTSDRRVGPGIRSGL